MGVECRMACTGMVGYEFVGWVNVGRVTRSGRVWRGDGGKASSSEESECDERRVI